MQNELDMKRAILSIIFMPLLWLSGYSYAQELLGVEIPKIGVFKDCTPVIDCTPTRSCEAISVRKDTRNCRNCLAKNPFGGCLVFGNNPLCEAAKASQNAAYQADAAGKKLDCERLKTRTEPNCETEKRVAKAECEAEKLEEVESASEISAIYTEFLQLSSKYEVWKLNVDLNNFVHAKILSNRSIDLRFYKVIDLKELFDRIIQIVRPDGFVNKDEIPKLAFSHLTEIQTIGEVTYLNHRYQLKVEDVIRSAIFSVFFDELSLDGMAQLQNSGEFDLKTIVDNKLVSVCEDLHSEKEKYTCDDDARLKKKNN